MFFSKCPENEYLAKNVHNYNAESKLLMLKNGGHPSFNHMGGVLFLSMIVHIKKSSMANILYFSEVASITGVHMKMYTLKENFVNVLIQYI